MAEYICKGPLLRSLNDWQYSECPDALMDAEEQKEAEMLWMTIEAVIQAVEKWPEADVVEVVRCKDCKWRDHVGVCTNPHCTKSFYGCPVNANHFCSYGERRAKTNFWDMISILCKKRHISISKVLKDIGLSPANATFWKKGSIPKGQTLQLLSNYFHVSTDCLLGRDDNG